MNPERNRRIPTERADLLAIAEYLGLEPNDAHMSIISGLDPEALIRVLDGQLKESPKREHIRVVGDLIRTQRQIRLMNTGNPSRGGSAIEWLETASVRTSEGSKTPLEIYANTKLATEARDEAARSLFG